jgi:hypothetical protein
VRLISLLSGERAYSSLLTGADGAHALGLGDGDPLAAATDGTIEEGRARLDGDRGSLEVSWTPAGPALGFAVDGATVSVHGIAASGAGPDGTMAGPGVVWELPDEGWARIRTVWAVSADSVLTVLVGLRPEGAREHGEELVGAARIAPREEPLTYIEPLISTEYDGDGAQRRATLELWAEGAELADRGAGRRIAAGGLGTPYGRLEAARFAWAFRGEPAAGGYEIISA